MQDMGQGITLNQESSARRPGKRLLRAAVGAWLFITLLACWGCSRQPNQDAFLIRVGSQTITVAEFRQAVEMAGEDAFAGDGRTDSQDYKDLRIRVLNQLTEELVILEKANTLGLAVTEAEVNQAVDQIKADYPDNTFEETLLENAVSFAIWRKRLAARLLIEKAIATELVDQVVIRPEDVAEYYQAHYSGGTPAEALSEEVNKRIVTHLRRQKAEEMYKAWIEDLRAAYPAEINQKQWERLNKEQENVH